MSAPRWSGDAVDGRDMTRTILLSVLALGVSVLVGLLGYVLIVGPSFLD
jgi:hypothetical protein